MVGALGCLVQERFHPMFDFDAPATFQLDAVLRTPGGQSGSFVLLVAVLFSEMYRARTGWMEPDVESFRLREDYSPGDLGFECARCLGAETEPMPRRDADFAILIHRMSTSMSCMQMDHRPVPCIPLHFPCIQHRTRRRACAALSA